MKTRKGGHIGKHEILKKILSIGYELETSSLAKLTKLEYEDNVLINTDTAGKDLEIIKSNAEDPDYAIRQEELIEIDAYTTESINTSAKIVDENVSFLISNDLSKTKFTKHLNTFCEPDEGDPEDFEFDKNELYRFQITGAGGVDGVSSERADSNLESYKINFETWAPKECGQFSDIEWIITYYAPKISDNIILDTFVNVVKNVLLHLSQLEETKGQLTIQFSDTDKEVIKTPSTRAFFHLPDTNLYYMQTQFLDNLMAIDDICISPQMTFSCEIIDAVAIFKHLLDHNSFKTPTGQPVLSQNGGESKESEDNSEAFEESRKTLRMYVSVILKIEACVDALFVDYNSRSDVVYKLGDPTAKLVVAIKNYLFMILYKLQRYCNAYLQYEKGIQGTKKAHSYLKTFLFFNSRHTNYDFYVKIKGLISEYFSNKLDDKTVVSIIHKLVVNQNVLEQYLGTKTRKNAFNIKNVIDKSNKNYGDPYYSLISYFHFFENPTDGENNMDSENEIRFYDWLQYADIDVYSSNQPIQENGVILVEFRAFYRKLSEHLSGIRNDALAKSMTQGACNQLQKRFQPDITSFTISTLRQFVAIYDSQTRGGRKRLTRKRKPRNKRGHNGRFTSRRI